MAGFGAVSLIALDSGQGGRMGWPAEQCLFPRPELGACGPMNDTREPTRADGSVALYPEAGRAGDTIHVACRNARPWKPAADLVVGFESHHHRAGRGPGSAQLNQHLPIHVQQCSDPLEQPHRISTDANVAVEQ